MAEIRSLLGTHPNNERPVMRGRIAFISLCALAFGNLTIPAHGDPPGDDRENGLIVFSANATGSDQLYTVEPDGANLRQITHLEGDAINADWSADGRRIVFEYDTPTAARLAVVNADGSNLQLIPSSVPPDGAELQPAFAPDGQHVVFEGYNGIDAAVYIEKLDGSQLRRVTGSPVDEFTDPNVSPDGNSLSFVRIRLPDVSQALFTTDLRGGNERQLTPFSFDVGIKQAWSPDGRRLVFTRNADDPKPGDSANLATIGADGKGLKMLTHYRGGDVNAYAGSYSPDGKWVVYRLADHGTFSLKKIRTDGSHATTILNVAGLIPHLIDWGPRALESSDER